MANYIVSRILDHPCTITVHGSKECIEMVEASISEMDNTELHFTEAKKNPYSDEISEYVIEVFMHSYKEASQLLDIIALTYHDDSKVVIHSTEKGFKRLGIDWRTAIE